MSDDVIRCAGCRKRATWKRLNREPWLLVTGLCGSLDVGAIYYCPDCQHDTEAMRPGLYVLWAEGEKPRCVRFQPTGVTDP